MSKRKTTRGRKRSQKTVMCHMTLNTYKMEECVKITKLGDITYNMFVSKVWWEANKKKTKEFKFHSELV